MTKEYLTVKEVALLLQVHKHTIINFIKNGDLSAIQLKREYRISKESLERFVSNKATKVKR